MPRPERTPLQKALAGPAGEAYVLFRLYQRGMLASLAPPGSPTVDVLVLAPDETVIASLQVKTRHHGRDRGWMLRKKHESIVQDRYFYALVDLEPDSPVVYIVPSAVVADVIAKNHRAWLNAPGRGGRPHQDNEMRRVAPDYGDLEVPGYPAGGWTSTESGGYCLSGSSRTTLPRRDPRPSLPTPAAARPITVRGAFPNTGPVRRSGT